MAPTARCMLRVPILQLGYAAEIYFVNYFQPRHALLVRDRVDSWGFIGGILNQRGATLGKGKQSRQMRDAEQELIQIGLNKGYIKIEGNKVVFTAVGKKYDFSDPEEKVRARVYVELIEKYKYSPNRVDLEIYPPRREPKLPADIVVYEDDEREKTYIVIETKATSTKNDVELGKKQGLGNANLLNARYLLVACGKEEMAYDLKTKPSLKTLDKYTIPQLPIHYGKLPKYRFKKGGELFFELRKADFNELRSKFQRCHDEIWEGGKRDPAESFDEMSKLMFAKIFDERFTKLGEYYKFQIGTNEDVGTIADRARERYMAAQSKEPGVFAGELKVPDRVINAVVEILQDISLIQTDLDAKGRAFEHFLSEIFRGKLGQYFTRREIVEFMVSMLEPTEDDLVIDPACGSGGFLLYCMKQVREKIQRDYAGDQRSIDRIDWDFSHKQVFGIDINDRIARVAMMDMVIHDDGHSNIECNDALTNYQNFDRRKDIRSGKYSLLLTNPPFGAVVKDQKVLKQYELGSKVRKRNSQKTEILFIERCLDLLKSKGRMGIVLPDGVLTNSSLQYVRDFIERKAKILVAVSLPRHAFVPSGSGVKASLIFLQKKKRENQNLGNYPIFMSIVGHVGYDATGRPDTNDFPKILEDWGKFKRGELK